MKRLALAVALGFAAVSTQAGPYEDALAAYESGDYATALRLWHPLAEQGHPAAQFNLSVMYTNGQGVPKDYAEALKWRRRAAERGYPPPWRRPKG